MNITASTLYLIAAPSTPKEGRVEVLQRTSNAENIGYTKAKAIVSQHRKTKKGAVEPKTAPLKPDEPVNVIESRRYETMSAISAQENLTEKDALAETRPLLTLESKPDVAFETKQIATTIKDIPVDPTQTPTSMENRVAISHSTSDAAIASMSKLQVAGMLQWLQLSEYEQQLQVLYVDSSYTDVCFANQAYDFYLRC